MLREWTGGQGWALAIGLGLTLAAVGLHSAGVTERLELLVFDFHVRHFSRIPASPRIVHINIDDEALERVESWPWPRDLQAELIRILHELQAERIVMDLVWAEPRRAEVRLPVLDRYADIQGVEQLGEVSAENLVFPDDELAAAIAAAGNVYLAMYDEQITPAPRSALAEEVAELLRSDFELDAPALAKRLGADLAAVEGLLAGAKRHVAEELVSSILQANPHASPLEVHAAILSAPFDRRTADREDVLAAYLRQLSLRALRRSFPPVPEGLRGRLPAAGRIVPPVYKFSAGARAAGFVTFQPDLDGRTRHIPLLMEWNGLLIEQLAFRAARDALGIEPDDLSIDGSTLRIRGRDGRPALRVQLDERGQMLVNWHVPPGSLQDPPGWQACFTHIPVTRLLQIYDARRAIADNRTNRDLAIARAMRIVKDDTAFEGYRRQVNTLLDDERKVRWATLQGRGDAEDVQGAAARAAILRRQVENDQAETLAFIAEQWAALQEEPDPDDPEIAEDYRRFREAHRLISVDVPGLEQINAAIERRQQRWMDELRPAIAGKTCLVGYTATAVADMVNAPSFPRLPGVVVHSNVLNSFLQKQFRTWSGWWGQVGIIALFGAMTTLVASGRSPWQAFALVLLAIAASAVLSTLALFQQLDHWAPLVTALVLVFVVWAIIVLFRYLIVDRQKRHFSRAVSQYVSPAVARQIARSSTPLNLAPASREVTCFFSDLEGFTRISERLGPEGTRTVLNPYLEAMSLVLHRHQALINKFMGDGIFAFFNPPILPCPGHAAAACGAALASRTALQELALRHAAHPMSAEFRRLRMRIGVASGPVFVGDYGSENKLDYTCVGDTVNLAARLEAANKVFGTDIILSAATQGAAGDSFLFRRLGRLQVVGQTTSVSVYELLGRAGEVNGQVLQLTDVFETALEAFAARDWDRGFRLFERCLEIKPDEPATLRYLRTIRQYQVSPPEAGWDGTLALTEK